jgi:hypothetical protein
LCTQKVSTAVNCCIEVHMGVIIAGKCDRKVRTVGEDSREVYRMG